MKSVPPDSYLPGTAECLPGNGVCADILSSGESHWVRAGLDSTAGPNEKRTQKHREGLEAGLEGCVRTKECGPADILILDVKLPELLE